MLAYLDERAQVILRAWTKDPILRFERLPGGVVNDTWLVARATNFPLEPSGRLYDDAIQWGSQIGEYGTEATLAEIERLLAAVRRLQHPNE